MFLKITDHAFSIPNTPEVNKATVTTATACTANVLYISLYVTGKVGTTKASIIDCIRLNDLWIELAMEGEESRRMEWC